jgi:hypothetical protein
MFCQYKRQKDAFVLNQLRPRHVPIEIGGLALETVSGEENNTGDRGKYNNVML